MFLAPKNRLQNMGTLVPKYMSQGVLSVKTSFSLLDLPTCLSIVQESFLMSFPSPKITGMMASASPVTSALAACPGGF